MRVGKAENRSPLSIYTSRIHYLSQYTATTIPKRVEADKRIAYRENHINIPAPMLRWLSRCNHRKVAVLTTTCSLFFFVLSAINGSETVIRDSFGRNESAFVLSVAEQRNAPSLQSQEESHLRRATFIKNITPAFQLQSSLTGTVTVSSSATTQTSSTARSPFASRCLDFYLIGWPKTGSTALAQVLQYHPEVVMPLEESTQWWRKQPEPLATLNRELLSLEQRKRAGSFERKRGIKFPGEYKERGGLKALHEHGCNATKIIIGIRHPMELFESFYNYRVQEWHAPGSWFYQKEGPIPLPNELMDNRNWGDGVNLNFLRFDQYLKRLEKVPYDKSSEPWKGWEETPPPSWHLPNRVFLYHIDQLGDAQESRLELFRTQLQSFLNLTQPLQSFRKTNSLRRTYNETIDICDSKHTVVQKALVEVGQEAHEWIKNHFLQSDDVDVANRDHFETLLGEFLENPCEVRNK